MNMRKWLLSAGLLVLTAGRLAAADVRLGAYRAAETDGMRELYATYLDGVKGGLMSANAWLKSHGQQPVFCPPEHLPITTEQLDAIMLSSAKRRVGKDETLVALLLMSGLQDTYPCGKVGSRVDGSPSRSSPPVE